MSEQSRFFLTLQTACAGPQATLLPQRLGGVDPRRFQVLQHVGAGKRGEEPQQHAQQLQQLSVARHADDFVRQAEARLLPGRSQSVKNKNEQIERKACKLDSLTRNACCMKIDIYLLALREGESEPCALCRGSW